MGVSMLPRFTSKIVAAHERVAAVIAAIVCRQTTGVRSFLPDASGSCPSTAKENGTKVRSATSFVISILQKKHKPTRTNTREVMLFVRDSREYANRVKTP